MSNQYEISDIKKYFKDQPTATVVSTIQPKGGVGKTTETIHLGTYAAQLCGLRVLLIDQDQSCNLSENFMDSDTIISVPNLKSLYQADKRVAGELESVTPTRVRDYDSGGSIDLLPSFPDLSFAEHSNEPGTLNRIKLWLTKAKFNKEYDLVVIDNPGTFGSLNMSAMTAANFWISPLEMTSFGKEGINRILSYIDDIKDYNNPLLDTVGCIPFKVVSTEKSYKRMVDTLKEEGLTKYLLNGFDTQIRARAAVKAAIDEKEAVWNYNQGDEGARKAGDNFKEVMNFVLAKIAGMTEVK